MDYALILSGGSGTRLWPLSRRARPKHLVWLAGSKPLLDQTLDRLEGLIPAERRFLITIPEQAPIVRDAARGRAAGIIIEPVGRNNLFPMALSTRMLADRDPDARIVFLPSDHSLAQPGMLRQALELALEVAGQGYIVTLGIPTKYAEPNYGHIQKGDVIPGFGGRAFPVFEAKSFREKPPLELAEEMDRSTEWFWNCGIFIYSASGMLELVAEAQPELARILDDLAPSLAREVPIITKPVCDWEAEQAIREAYLGLPKKLQTSIDYALMEKARRVAMIPVEMGWSDLGGFSALSELLEPVDETNRVALGKDGGEARVLLPGCTNVTVFPGKRTVVCLDCKDLIVVDTSDALLILPRESSGRVREVVEQIKQRGWTDLL